MGRCSRSQNQGAIKMRVLHLPVNLASYMYHTVKGLREIGVDVRSLAYNNSPMWSSEGLVNLRFPPRKK